MEHLPTGSVDYFKHSGWNAMGTDAVDINNDGLVDLVSLEMLPESNMRKKRMLSGNEYYNYTNAAKLWIRTPVCAKRTAGKQWPYSGRILYLTM